MSRDPLHWLHDELQALDDLHLRRYLQVRESPQSGHEIVIDGERFLNFGSNDYLGLAARLRERLAPANPEIGWGSGASPLITGRGSAQARLETSLAEFEEAEAALLFPTGYAANLGTVSALAGQGDVIFSDEKNHASIIDGCRLSRARVQVYPHNDVDYLRMMLEQSSVFRRRFIVADSVFSMDGDLAPLDQLLMLAQEYDAALIVDEAHATGVFGKHGRGLCEHFGIENEVHVRIGTMSKALGTSGGFVVGSQPLIDWLTNRARSFVFSTALPDGVIESAQAALQLIIDEQPGGKLLETSERFRNDVLAPQGWDTAESDSQIIPLMVGDPQRTMEMAAELRKSGCFVPGIRPPTVPQGESLLRISLTVDHSEQDLERLGQALASLTG